MGKQPTDAPVSIRLGSGHGMLVKVLGVIGEPVPVGGRNSDGGPGGSRTGS